MNVFDLVATLKLKKEEFDNGVSKVKSELEKVKQGFEKFGSVASKIATPIGKGLKAVATPIVEITKLAGKAAIELGKLSAKAIAAGTVAVAKLTKDAVDAYASYEQLAGGVETLFGDASLTVMHNAAKAYETTGQSMNQYMEQVTSFSASLIQSFGKDTENVQEKAAQYADRAMRDMADNANKMGTSMESIQNAYQGFSKQNYTMLDNLKLGYGGTAAEMQRLIKDAAKMKDEQEKLGITIDASSMSFGNIVNAISVMQEHMGIAGTTSEEAAKTISGSVAAMKAAWANFLTMLSESPEEIEITLNELVETALVAFHNIFNTASEALQGISDALEMIAPMVIKEIPPLIAEILPVAMETVVKLLNTVVKMLPDLLTGLLPPVLKGVTEVFNNLVRILPSLIQKLVPVVVNAVIMLAQTLVNNTYQIISAIMQMITSVLSELAKAMPKLITMADAFIDSFTRALLVNLPALISAAGDLMMALIEGLVKSIPKILAAATAIMKKLLETFLSHIPQMIQSGIKLLQSLVKGLADAIPQLLPVIAKIMVTIFIELIKAIPQIVQAGWQILQALGQALLSGVSAMADIGRHLIEGLWEGIKRVGEWLKDKVLGFLDGLLGGMLSFLGIRSPSRVMADMGKQLVAGLGLGVEKNAKMAMDPLMNLAEDMSGVAIEPSLSMGASAQGIGARGAGGVVININGADKDPEQIAREVQRVFTSWERQREAVFA